MIDTTTYALDIASGTALTAGQEYPLKCIDGPANVRSGRGSAILKRIISFQIGNAGVKFYIKTKNSDWIDPVINESGDFSIVTLDRRTGAYQNGNNCPLTPNSSWEVVAVPIDTIAATTGAVSLVSLIDIDYPEVSSITDPDALPGIPATINVEAAITTHAVGSLETSAYDIINVDIFKAGYEYALQKCTMMVKGASAGQVGFIALSNAAGMGGLKRVIPVKGQADTIANIIEYSSKLRKGPMDIGFKFLDGSPASRNVIGVFDFVKRRIA